ncbi:MAG: hypothetical protein DRQ55_08610 [Planctomycetota bacterium]|nr:MAG: hypothetical protein DRQ55_08610 [Planctomycetota bacterium]
MRSHLALATLLAAALFLAAPLASGQAPLALQLVAHGLEIPVFATAPPGDLTRIFVLELYTGRVRLIKNGQLQAEPFLDLGGQIQPVGERGLLGMAFHPQYERNGSFFLFYNNVDGHTVLVRYQEDPNDPDRALPAGQLLLQIEQHFLEHNGGMIQFGPDGMLYLGSGDGGGPLDPLGNAQALDSLLGKVLRLDVDGGSPYAIPADNPFVGVAGARPEIWLLGLRNPWRLCVDPVSGALLVGDVGVSTMEEVTRVPADGGGANLGWRCMEANLCTGLSGCACSSAALVAPTYQYSHDEGCAVIGGFVYRGQDLPGYAGRYFLADWCSGFVRSMRIGHGPATTVVDHADQLVSGSGQPLVGLTSFGLDGRGELLLMSASGTLYRIVPAADCDGDGTPDAVELADGSAFDVDANGVPDACEPALHAAALALGETNLLTYLGAEPGQPVAFFGSISGLGAGPCFVGGAICLDILPFEQSAGIESVLLLGIVPADAQGAAYLPLPLPDSAPASFTEVALQAVAWAGAHGSTVSPPLLLPVTP